MCAPLSPWATTSLCPTSWWATAHCFIGWRRDSTLSIGRVKALPGDTIRVDTLQYQIPDTCCSRCDCEGCQLLLVQVGKKETLVKRKQLRGRVYRLFNLNLW